MRISNNMLMREMLFNLNHNQNRMAKYQKQLSSGGRRIFRPSDDPVGISRVLKYTSDVNVLNQFKASVTAANGYNNVTESAVMNIKEILHTIREHAIAAGNEPKSPEDIKKYAVEIAQLKEELVILGNSTNGGNFIFSGLESDKKLFNKDGTFSLLMTSERLETKPVVEYEITVGEIMKVGVHPADLFGYIPNNNPMLSFMPRGEANATPATRAELSMLADATQPYNGRNITVRIDGTPFVVDTTKLTHDHVNPMDKKRFLAALGDAENPANEKLSAYADIFFDDNDRLIIRNKKAGAAHTVAITQDSTHITDIRSVNGTNSVPGEYVGTALGGLSVSDDLVKVEDGVFGIVVNHINGNGEAKQVHLELDFSKINTAADLQTALQSGLNSGLGAGVVNATVAHGQPIRFEVTEGQIKVDSVVATKSKMLNDVDKFIAALNAGDYDQVRKNIDIMSKQLDTTLAVLGDIGGRTNRLDYIKNRIDDNANIFSELMQNLKYEDYGKLITMFKDMENVYRASLSVGSRIIQPSLVDFIK